jgi:xylulose-5-phosphate/fructose-6-phosphate phosphoketolase
VANTLSMKDAAPTADAPQPLSPDEVALLDAYWRACNYLSVGMIYLRDNPLLKEPLTIDQVKHRLLGHWGASRISDLGASPTG